MFVCTCQALGKSSRLCFLCWKTAGYPPRFMDVTWCDQKFHHVWLFLAAILTPKNRRLRTESETVKTCLTEFSRSYFRICVLSLLDRVILILVDWTTMCVGKHKGTFSLILTRMNDRWPTQISPCLSFGAYAPGEIWMFFDWNPMDDPFLGKARNQNGIFDDPNVFVHHSFIFSNEILIFIFPSFAQLCTSASAHISWHISRVEQELTSNLAQKRTYSDPGLQNVTGN